MACRGRSWQDLRFGLPLPRPDPINQSFYALLLRVNAIAGGELTSLTWFVQATSAKLKALEVLGLIIQILRLQVLGLEIQALLEQGMKIQIVEVKITFIIILLTLLVEQI